MRIGTARVQTLCRGSSCVVRYDQPRSELSFALPAAFPPAFPRVCLNSSSRTSKAAANTASSKSRTFMPTCNRRKACLSKGLLVRISSRTSLTSSVLKALYSLAVIAKVMAETTNDNAFSALSVKNWPFMTKAKAIQLSTKNCRKFTRAMCPRLMYGLNSRVTVVQAKMNTSKMQIRKPLPVKGTRAPQTTNRTSKAKIS
mmetsp:Transcript_21513/g.72954  ORF Transcript_21513/g.72954 Transcript_21513/m.72954 type:complete len:200 (-) Transcript_21513:3422-4021(-)